jgi:type IV secretion system protein VirD4
VSFRVLGSPSPEAIELGRLVHPRNGISNKIRYDEDRHVLIFGANGSGKGTRILLPNLLDMRGARSLVVVDPKGELAAVSAPFRRSVGRVVMLNPFGVLTDRQGFEDMESVGFNPSPR